MRVIGRLFSRGRGCRACSTRTNHRVLCVARKAAERVGNRTCIYKSCGVTLSWVAVVTEQAVSTQSVVEVRHHRAVAARALATVHLVWLPTPATRATNQRRHATTTPRTRQTGERIVRTRATLPTQAIPVRHQRFCATIPTRLNYVNHDAFFFLSSACRSQWPGSIDTHTWRAPSARLGIIRDCTRNGFFFAPISAL